MSIGNLLAELAAEIVFGTLVIGDLLQVIAGAERGSRPRRDPRWERLRKRRAADRRRAAVAGVFAVTLLFLIVVAGLWLANLVSTGGGA